MRASSARAGAGRDGPAAAVLAAVKQQLPVPRRRRVVGAARRRGRAGTHVARRPCTRRVVEDLEGEVFGRPFASSAGGNLKIG